MNISLDEKFFTDLYNLEHNNYIDFKYNALRAYNGVWYRAYKNLIHKFAIDIKPTQDLLNFVFKELDFCESAGYTPYHTPFDYFDYLDDRRFEFFCRNKQSMLDSPEAVVSYDLVWEFDTGRILQTIHYFNHASNTDTYIF